MSELKELIGKSKIIEEINKSIKSNSLISFLSDLLIFENRRTHKKE
jgi:hypothetical protein